MASTTVCPRCGGTGFIPAFAHVHNGMCFKCHGTGLIDVETGTTAHSQFYVVTNDGITEKFGSFAECSAYTQNGSLYQGNNMTMRRATEHEIARYIDDETQDEAAEKRYEDHLADGFTLDDDVYELYDRFVEYRYTGGLAPMAF